MFTHLVFVDGVVDTVNHISKYTSLSFKHTTLRFCIPYL